MRYKPGIEKGSTVVITNKLKGSKTHNDHNLDSKTGYMLGMQGKMYKVSSRTSRSVEIHCLEAKRSFTFHIDDVHLADDTIDKMFPIPDPELFDTKRLDI